MATESLIFHQKAETKYKSILYNDPNLSIQHCVLLFILHFVHQHFCSTSHEHQVWI